MDQARLDFARDELLDVPVPAQRTSHASRRSAERLIARRAQGPKLRRLLLAYADAGARGATASEIEEAAGLMVQSICSLRKAAVDRGWLVAIGERMGRHGVEQTVHRLTEAGRAALGAMGG